MHGENCGKVDNYPIESAMFTFFEPVHSHIMLNNCDLNIDQNYCVYDFCHC